MEGNFPSVGKLTNCLLGLLGFGVVSCLTFSFLWSSIEVTVLHMFYVRELWSENQSHLRSRIVLTSLVSWAIIGTGTIQDDKLSACRCLQNVVPSSFSSICLLLLGPSSWSQSRDPREPGTERTGFSLRRGDCGSPCLPVWIGYWMRMLPARSWESSPPGMSRGGRALLTNLMSWSCGPLMELLGSQRLKVSVMEQGLQSWNLVGKCPRCNQHWLVNVCGA